MLELLELKLEFGISHLLKPCYSALPQPCFFFLRAWRLPLDLEAFLP